MRTTGTRKRTTGYNWQQSATPTEGVCVTCNQVWPEQWDRACKRPTPVHCTGTSSIFGHRVKPVPHHGFIKYPPCWRCNADSGCDQCAGQYPVCRRCAVHVTPAGLAANGPVCNSLPLIAKRRGLIAADLAHYPLDFQAAYRAAPMDALAQQLSQSRDPLRRALTQATAQEATTTPAELRKMVAQGERNRQAGVPVAPYVATVDDEENEAMTLQERPDLDDELEYEEF